MQIWLSFLRTSMPLWSWLASPLCGVDRVGTLVWGSVCHHVEREASRFIPSTLQAEGGEVSVRTEPVRFTRIRSGAREPHMAAVEIGN